MSQVDIVQPNCYNSENNHLRVTATAIVQKQNMVNGTNNFYPKNEVDIAHDETIPKVPISVKRKTKQSNKSKDISDRERQLDEQLIQCKARIAMLEDLNRDYKNTINLLRSQLEIKKMLEWLIKTRDIIVVARHSLPKSSILKQR